jgi:hypothetical protein
MRPLLVAVLPLALLACGPPDRPWCHERGPLPELRRCEGCGPTVRSELKERDLKRSLDIAFVAEGFTPEHLDDFERQTHTWMADFEASLGPQVPGLSPLLNAWWIDFRELAPADGFSLGTCMAERGVPDRGVSLAVDEARLRSLVTQPDLDVVVVVLNASTRLRENGGFPWWNGWPVVTTNTLTDSAVFAHELGHSLFGLHDEYSEIDGSPELVGALAASEPDTLGADSTVFLAPNVSLNPRSPKFGGADVGALGGMGFQRGVFHRAGPCLMNEGGDLCPICQRAARDRVAARLGQSTANPRCALRVADAADGQRLVAAVFASDWDGLANVRVRGPDGVEKTTGLDGMFGTSAIQVLPHTDLTAFPVEATCVDLRGQSSSVRVDVSR